MTDTLTFTRNDDGTITLSQEACNQGSVEPYVTHGDAVMRLVDWLRGSPHVVVRGMSPLAGDGEAEYTQYSGYEPLVATPEPERSA